MEQEEEILQKIIELKKLVGALAGQMSEANHRIWKLEKKK